MYHMAYDKVLKVRVRADTYEAIVRLAHELDVSVSALIRMACLDVITTSHLTTTSTTDH